MDDKLIDETITDLKHGRAGRGSSAQQEPEVARRMTTPHRWQPREGMGRWEAPNTTSVTDKTCIWHVFLSRRCNMTLSYVGKLWMLPLESMFLLFGTMMTRVPSKKKVTCRARRRRIAAVRLRHRRLHAYDPLPRLNS